MHIRDTKECVASECRSVRISFVTLLVILLVLPLNIASAARLKDIADIEGVRGNDLIGYGIVTGLKGTGDKKGTLFTSQGTSNLLERLGMRVAPKELQLANVAAVIVTATLPPFSRPGSKIDVTLSSLGDATTLQGGVLLMTPLRGADGKVYAVAQGTVSVGGFLVSSDSGDSAQKNHPTVGIISRGASVERAIPFDLFASGQIRVVLKQPDFTTITRVRTALEQLPGIGHVEMLDSGSVAIPLDKIKGVEPVELVSRLETVSVEPDSPAKIVLNERTGTIIMGDNVTVSSVALAHGNLNITIRSEDQVSQPNALAGGSTAITQNQDINVGEEGGQLTVIRKSVTLRELVNALNGLGATPLDLISILQAMKKAGALHADLVMM